MSFEGQSPLAALAGLAAMLSSGRLDDAKSDARLLLCAVLDVNMHGLLMRERAVDGAEASVLGGYAQRRMAGEPTQYILGSAHFMGLELLVTPDVLIPRRDSETIVTLAASLAPQGSMVADVCTGSGCLALALKKQRPDLSLVATDISDKALSIARENAARQGERIDFRQGDLCAPLAGERYGLLLSNPPYVRDGEALSREVRGHEPALALFGGADGLVVYRRLIPQAQAHLLPGGWLCVEIGYDQAPQVVALFEQQGYQDVTVAQDLERRPRVVYGRQEERAVCKTD